MRTQLLNVRRLGANWKSARRRFKTNHSSPSSHRFSGNYSRSWVTSQLPTIPLAYKKKATSRRGKRERPGGTKQTQRGQNTGEQNEQEDRERERERRQIQSKNEYRESERKQRETWKEKKTREEDQEQRDKENPGEHKINEERFLGFFPGLQQRNVCCLLNNRSPNHPKTKETETDTNRDRENKKSKKKPSKEKQDQKRSKK